MKRFLIAVLAATAVAALASSMAGASTSRSKLQLRKTGVGTILVNGRGFTIYAFTKDGRNRDACASISGCLGLWPIVGGAAKPQLGPGVKSALVGTIVIKGGAKQVTYAGHPLYTYAEDSDPGETSYVNVSQFGGRWPAVNASGREVK